MVSLSLNVTTEDGETSERVLLKLQTLRGVVAEALAGTRWQAPWDG